MMLALTAAEEVRCSGESADVSALSASGMGKGEGWKGPLEGTKEGRKEEGEKGACERWPPSLLLPPR